MPKALLIVIVFIIIIFGGFLLLSGSSDDAQPTTNNNTTAATDSTVDTLTGLGPDLGQAPDFSFKDYNGNIISLADFRGKPVVLNAWAAWCPFCVNELPAFAAVQSELGDAITIISIDRAESLNTAKSYTDDLGVSNGLVLLLDPGDSFYTSIGGFTMPETLLVDGNGIIRFHKRGTMDANELKQRLKDNLGVN